MGAHVVRVGAIPANQTGHDHEARVTSNIAVFAGLLLALQMKHLFADFFLQTPYMIENRRVYGHPGGLLHVAIHILGSGIVFAAFASSVGPVWGISLILFAEALFHYHIDWAKDRIVLRYALTPKDRNYWIATGTDQALHQLTYVAMALAWWSMI